jgi:hypothetical protein
VSRNDEPLLARPTSPQSSTQDRAKEDALLTGQRTERRDESKRTWRERGLFIWTLLATVAVIILGVVYQHSAATAHKSKSGGWGPDGKPTGKRNIIFMVSDGMGPTSLSLTRSYRQYTSGLPVGFDCLNGHEKLLACFDQADELVRRVLHWVDELSRPCLEAEAETESEVVTMFLLSRPISRQGRDHERSYQDSPSTSPLSFLIVAISLFRVLCEAEVSPYPT